MLTAIYFQELVLSYNEIRADGGIAIGKACSSLSALSVLDLDGNQFGEDGKKQVRNLLLIWSLGTIK